MRPTLRLSATVATLVVGAVAAGWVFGRPALSRRHDVDVRRSLYQSFPTFPGATKADERSYEIRADGVGTGDYGLTVSYRLPAAASPSEVLDFFRANMPTGWSEATDETCARLESQMPPPPVATLPADTPALSPAPPTTGRAPGLLLMRREDELAAFAPDGDGADGTDRSGVTFKVSTAGQVKLLTLSEVTFACAPPSG